jgi:hypothetical protein
VALEGVASPNGIFWCISVTEGRWRDHDCPLGSTGLNGTQCLPDSALVCTFTHFVDGSDLGVQEKGADRSGVTRYVRIVEIAGSSPVTSTNHKGLIRTPLRVQVTSL